MSAIAGTVGDSDPTNLRSSCTAAIEVLDIYGTGMASFRQVRGACFAVDRHPCLPEDQAGDGPTVAGDVIIAADIRLDNRQELIGLLVDGRASPADTSDADLAALAWSKWGAEGLDRLIGDFAIAAFDPANQSLILARDPTGARPLFYTIADGIVAFASMPSGMLALPGRRFTMNRTRIASTLLDQAPQESETLFEEIYAVLPNQRLTFCKGQVSAAKIWSPTFEPLLLPAREDYEAAYREVLDRAVEARLRRIDGPVASQLSAGFDSSAVTATAARLMAGGESSVIAFTHAPSSLSDGILPQGVIGDESQLAAEIAGRYAIDHEILRGQDDPLGHLAGQAATYQQPYRNVLNSGWDTDLARLARQRGCRVLLTGEFGNLTLNAGGISVISDYLRSGRIADWLGEAIATRSNPEIRARSLLFNSFAPWLPVAVGRWLRKRYLTIDSNERGFVRAPWAEQVHARAVTTVAPRNGEARRRWRLIETLDPAMVRKGLLGDTGMDYRDPLNDRNVIQFSLRLPTEQLFSDGRGWPLARRALADRLPPSVLKSRLRGYQSADWNSRMRPEQLLAMVAEIERSDIARDVIDFEALRAAINDWPRENLARGSIVATYTGRIPMALAMGYYLLHLDRNAAVN